MTRMPSPSTLSMRAEAMPDRSTSLSRMPFTKRVFNSLMRTVSAEYRALTDIFVDPYNLRVDWKSGVGEGLHTLYGLARSLRPRVIVEIGSARGKSTCALALACRQNGNGKVY